MNSVENKIEKKINEILSDFGKYCLCNKVETMEYYEEIQQMREYAVIGNMKKVVNELYSRFCINNGLWNKIENYGNLAVNDEYKALVKLWTMGIVNYNIKDRYYDGIVNWYLSRLDERMEDLNFEDIELEAKKGKVKIAHLLYDKTPAIYMKIKKPEKLKELNKTYLNQIETVKMENIKEFIKIGKCIQFDVKGFPMNETLYLLVGILIKYLIDNDIVNKSESMRELILKHIVPFVQLNILSLCLTPKDKMEGSDSSETSGNKYNLVTYIKSNGEYNYRYKCAEKYFKSKPKGKTEYVDSENEKYIVTEYASLEEYKAKWDELDEMFKSGKLTDELIVKWFDSQLMTRSTCLIGCILIILKEGKLIKFKKNEMPDWKSIALNTFEDTYCVLDELNKTKIFGENVKLKDVLSIITNYILSHSK